MSQPAEEMNEQLSEMNEQSIEVEQETQIDDAREAIAANAKRVRQESLEADAELLDPTPEPINEPEPDNKAENNTDVETLVIDGQEKEVNTDELIEAGKKAKSLEQAAYRRFEEAAKMKQEAEHMLQYNQLKAQEFQSKPVEATQPQDEDTDIDEKAAKITEQLLYGEGDEEIKQFIADSLRAQHTEPAKEIDPAQVDQIVQKKLHEQEIKNEINSANQAFSEKYPDIASDQALYQLANQETVILQRENPYMSPKDIIFEAGERIMKRYGSVIGSKRTEKEQRKSESAPVVNSMSARVPAPPPIKPKTKADVIAEIRAKRGQDA